MVVTFAVTMPPVTMAPTIYAHKGSLWMSVVAMYKCQVVWLVAVSNIGWALGVLYNW